MRHLEPYHSQQWVGRVLIMTAVEAERDAVLRGLRGAKEVDVMLAGVGAASAAAHTARALTASGPYGLVVSAGIGGGFAGRAEVGSIVIADAIVAADLGAETGEGFSSLDELGFGTTRMPVAASLADRLQAALSAAGLPACSGPVLTVATVTGTAETARELSVRVPGAAAEAMEGYGVAAAAAMFGLPALEIRTISNAVGPRDRSAWRIPDALAALEAASSTLREVLQQL
ncbi:hypothetical protein BG53_03345 [Paenibacillus darwinianus]|uniref:Futalosine hydrolase n=1 Tax=Paenibacillus darwinianus TaxID=1380763 RepID=A0A9W5S1L2_9BACL|nr:futalosine hydrolase [Paenibacillus darwinianus]EXX86866.1 hypothetical protein BG52_05540 [Paenibacillus darwinianus]EXX87855.1 hypothetical protein BG53_03345 [Paenibacillus darwinianus]EXX88073.1 hypothetical protein CH50_04300 [Paenibacillus darwinianus]